MAVWLPMSLMPALALGSVMLSLWGEVAVRVADAFIRSVTPIAPDRAEDLKEQLRQGTRPERMAAARGLIHGGNEGFKVLELELGGAGWGLDINDVTSVVASLGDEAVPMGMRLWNVDGYTDYRRHPAPILFERMGVLALPALGQILASSVPADRYDAIGAISEAVGRKAGPGCAPWKLLARCTEDPAPWVRARAFQWLGGDAWARMWMAGLAEGLRGKWASYDDQEKRGMIEVGPLALILPAATGGVLESEKRWELIQSRAASAEASKRVEVPAVIASFGANAEPGIKVLEQLLRDPDLAVALEAAKALAGLGEVSSEAIERGIQDEDPEVRRLALQARVVTGFLKELPMADYAAMVEKGLADRRQVVIEALGAAGDSVWSPELKDSWPRLLKAVKAVDTSFSEEFTEAQKQAAELLERAIAGRLFEPPQGKELNPP